LIDLSQVFIWYLSEFNMSEQKKTAKVI